MGFIDFLRDTFTRDQAARKAAAGGVDTGDMPVDLFGNVTVQSMAHGIVSDHLTLNNALMSRYIDYERMDAYPDCSAALSIYADDSTTLDAQRKHVLWVECRDDQVRNSLEAMFYRKLQVDDEAWESIRMLVKYGSAFEEVMIHPTQGGVEGLNYLPAPTCRRLEGKKGDLKGFVQSFRGNFGVPAEGMERIKFSNGVGRDPSSNVVLFEPWRIVNMRLRSQRRRAMYGVGVLEPARWVWRRLTLLEDAALISRLSRAPSRFAFYVDVGKMPTERAEKYLDKLRQKLKKRKFVNPTTGSLDLRYSPHSTDEDFFLPVREGREVVRADVLNTPQWTGVEDVEYFRNKLHAALMIPRAYLGYDENQPSRATLCIAGDTRIPLLNGKEMTIQEMAGRGGEHWVYSCDRHGKTVLGLARNARKTRHGTETVIVTLSNGNEITCTPDHPFMLRNGTYQEAQNLRADDPLMSFHRGVVDRVDGNHEVVSIRPGLRTDCYDLTVGEHHNFAVSAGVFIHNSQEDVRFAKSILRVQREYRKGMTKVAKVHLASRGIDPQYVDYKVVMTVPSSIFELAQLEVQNMRAQFAQQMGEIVSQQWLLSNVFGFTDSEIEKVMGQRREEQKAAMGANPGGQFEDVNSIRFYNGMPKEEAMHMIDRAVQQLGHRDRIPRSSMAPLQKQSLDERLNAGRNHRAERRVESKLDRVLQENRNLSNRLAQTNGLMSEIKHAIGQRKIPL